MIAATQLRAGNVIKHDGDLFSVFSVTHRTPGNLRAFVQAKLRNLRTGAMIEHRFRSEDRVDQAILDDTEMQFLYRDGDDFHFMNTESYEQINLHKDVLGESALYLLPEGMIKVEFYEGKPVGIELPAMMKLAVIKQSRAQKRHGRKQRHKAGEAGDRPDRERPTRSSMKAIRFASIPPKENTERAK